MMVVQRCRVFAFSSYVYISMEENVPNQDDDITSTQIAPHIVFLFTVKSAGVGGSGVKLVYDMNLYVVS